MTRPILSNRTRHSSPLTRSSSLLSRYWLILAFTLLTTSIHLLWQRSLSHSSLFPFPFPFPFHARPPFYRHLLAHTPHIPLATMQTHFTSSRANLAAGRAHTLFTAPLSHAHAGHLLWNILGFAGGVVWCRRAGLRERGVLAVCLGAVILGEAMSTGGSETMGAGAVVAGLWAAAAVARPRQRLGLGLGVPLWVCVVLVSAVLGLWGRGEVDERVVGGAVFGAAYALYLRWVGVRVRISDGFAYRRYVARSWVHSPSYGWVTTDDVDHEEGGGHSWFKGRR
ncbi:hypothetical protein F5B20DRAFT_588693 [Whalleya microplaca]|nr:hypothetical protein F5B20DRAFT_588693 [Whalleya microplaca]